MKHKNIFAVFAFALSAQALRATITCRPHTEIDRLTYGAPSKLIPAYMREHGSGGDEMLALLEANIAEHLRLASPGNTKEIAASISVGAIKHSGADLSARLDATAGYAEQEYPERIRSSAVSAYLHAGKLLSLPFATNVMTQAWRNYSERSMLRMMMLNMAKSAPPDERAKYDEFFKWAIDKSENGTSIDDNLLELEPSWRSNALRRVALGKLFQFMGTEYATNVLKGMIRDYEVSAGIHNVEARATLLRKPPPRKPTLCRPMSHPLRIRLPPALTQRQIPPIRKCKTRKILHRILHHPSPRLIRRPPPHPADATHGCGCWRSQRFCSHGVQSAFYAAK